MVPSLFLSSLKNDLQFSCEFSVSSERFTDLIIHSTNAKFHTTRN